MEPECIKQGILRFKSIQKQKVSKQANISERNERQKQDHQATTAIQNTQSWAVLGRQK